MSPTKLVVILGATGTQGGSVVTALQNDLTYRIRCVTRHTSSEKAKVLAARGLEVVAADVNEKASLIDAFQGAYAIYSVTQFFEVFPRCSAAQAQETELQHGKNLADAAASVSTLRHYVWSTLPSASRITNGRWPLPHSDGKADVDEYILSALPALAAKTTFAWVGTYHTNLSLATFRPTLLATAGKHIMVQPCSHTTPVVTIGDASVNVGIFVAAILAQPEITLPARYVLMSVSENTIGEWLGMWSEITGREAAYVQIDYNQYADLWAAYGVEMGLLMKFWEFAREKSWSKEGVEVLTGKKLGISGLVDLRQALETVDWS